MTCKDCLHYGVCEGANQPDYMTAHGDECKSFKNKADYAEVKYSKLNFAGYSLTGDRTYKCTECNFLVANIDDVQMNFCPGCGAKIDCISFVSSESEVEEE